MAIGAVAFAFCLQASEAAASAARGKALAQVLCSRCHGIERGQQSAHRDAPPFPEVARRYPPEHLAEALAEGIMVGHKDMPVFRLSIEEIDAFLDYLEAVGKPER